MAFLIGYLCKMDIQFSFVIPVFNRPEEIDELLQSFTQLAFSGAFEIVIVEDGSSIPCESVISKYRNALDISYYAKDNSGPGDSRNYGMERAKGNYYIILDSDCLLPPHYLDTVSDFLQHSYFDCYGGADAAHESFTPLQKAINYVMTSFVTTGGIRGRKNAVQKFEPRSFNMGISKIAFQKTKGFSDIHPGEDPDLSQRMLKAGFATTFIPNAYVYHKRRISWQTFYRQVRKFGLVRPILNAWHPHAAKLTFWFPTLFIAFTLVSLIATLFYSVWCILPLAIYALVIVIHASILNRSVLIGVYALIAMFIQFFGYGWAFLTATFYVSWLHKNPRDHFPSLFFK